MEFYGVRYPKGAKIVNEESKEVGWPAYMSVHRTWVTVTLYTYLQMCHFCHTGVRCIKSYVSKRKKRGYEFWRLVRFAGKLHHENPGKRTNPQIRTHVSYVYET